MTQPHYRTGELVETPDGVGSVVSASEGTVTVQVGDQYADYPDTSISPLKVATDHYPEFGTILVDRPDHEPIIRAAAKKQESPAYEEGYSQAVSDGSLRLPSSDDPEYRAEFQRGWSDGIAAHPDTPDPAQQTEDLPTNDPSREQTPFLPTTTGGFLLEKIPEAVWNMIPTPEGFRPGHNPSHDACAWRRNSRCWYPKSLNKELTDQKGIMVWNGEDRGYCPRIGWDEQRACPVFSAGPNDGGAPAPMTSDYIEGDPLR